MVVDELRANVNVQMDNGQTPLDNAYTGGKFESIIYLLRCGASTMIGSREWIHDDIYDVYPTTGRKIIRRAFFVSVLSRTRSVLRDHKRMLVDMLE